MNNRINNVYFWLGIAGVIFSAAGINIESLTSWAILFNSIVNILGNPFLLLSVVAAVIGVCVDPTSKGIRDRKEGE